MNNVNKALASGIVLAALLTSTTGAFASNVGAGNIRDAVNTTQAEAAPMVTSFGDVNQGDWYYNPVMKATQQGLFAGVGNDENGVPQFDPQGKMTRAAFITVIARLLELDTTGSDLWYEQAYLSALDSGLVTKGEMDMNSLTGDITRQEMAMIAVRAMEQRGETIGSVNTQNVLNSIPDNAKIGSYYRDFVVKAYSEGVLEGDNDGSFRPQGTLTRAEASTVIVKLIDSSERKKKDFSQSHSNPSQDLSQPIIIYEGQERSNRLAKAGDTVIKADGTEVVLVADPETGVVGAHQGVAPDLGLVFNVGQGDQLTTYALTSGDKATTNQYGVNSIGQNTASVSYEVNPLTGEGHWGGEWLVMLKGTRPQTAGTEFGEVSEDKNWVWDSMEWVPLASYPDYLN